MFIFDNFFFYDWVGRGGVCDVYKVILVDRAGFDGVRKDGGFFVVIYIFS